MNRQEFSVGGIARYSGVTEGGLTVHVFPRSGFRTKYACFAVKYGGCDRRFRTDGGWRDTPAGVAHFLEHKMFEMPGYTAIEKLTSLGARPNGFTSSDKTGYIFTCTENFMASLAELLTFVMTPYFTVESVAKEQGIIGQEIRMGEDEPARQARLELMRALYREHPIREATVGTAESIAQITPELLYEIHGTFYRPDDMVLCCAGDVDPEAIFDLASRLVPAGPGRKLPERDYGGADGPLPEKLRVEKRMSVSMPVFLLGSKLAFPPDGRDWARKLLLAELSCRLLLGEGSPLYGVMLDEGLINAGFSSGYTDFPVGGIVCAGGRSRQPQAVLGRIVDAAEDFRLDGEAQARFRRLQKAALGNFIMELDSLSGLCHTQADGTVCGWDPMAFPDLCRALEPEEAEAFLREYFRADRLALSVIAPQS